MWDSDERVHDFTPPDTYVPVRASAGVSFRARLFPSLPLGVHSTDDELSNCQVHAQTKYFSGRHGRKGRRTEGLNDLHSSSPVPETSDSCQCIYGRKIINIFLYCGPTCRHASTGQLSGHRTRDSVPSFRNRHTAAPSVLACWLE
jgi:hypothetical protein